MIDSDEFGLLWGIAGGIPLFFPHRKWTYFGMGHEGSLPEPKSIFVGMAIKRKTRNAPTEKDPHLSRPTRVTNGTSWKKRKRLVLRNSTSQYDIIPIKKNMDLDPPPRHSVIVVL